MAKTPNIQKSILTIVVGVPGYMYTNFQTNWTIFLGLDTFSVEKKISTQCPNFGKKYRFWPKNGHCSADFAEILGIDKNHLNTSYVKILGHLGLFFGKIWPFLVIFWPILAYNYIGENAGRASYCVKLRLAFTAISSEPLNRFSKCWPFQKEEIKGYQIR